MARLVELADSPDASLDTLNIAVAVRISVLPSRLRDAAWTVMHAQRAADLTRHRNPSLLLALARACRAGGDVARATQVAAEGLDLLPAAQPAVQPSRLFRLLTLAADPGRTDVGWAG